MADLKERSRFASRDADAPLEPETVNREVFSKTQPQFYDIKGNSFKNTLVPKQTAQQALQGARAASDAVTESPYKLKKVKPRNPHGWDSYKRSGMILFNNINQLNVADETLPRAKNVTKKAQNANRTVIEKGSQSLYDQWT